MTPLDEDEPVFAIDLTEETMRQCAADFLAPEGDPSLPRKPTRRRVPTPPRDDIRTIALIFDWDDDPVLLAIPPTKDTAMLDALARLLRGAMLTGARVSHLATEHGDPAIKRMYFARRFPRFVYGGIPITVRQRLPESLWRAMDPTRIIKR